VIHDFWNWKNQKPIVEDKRTRVAKKEIVGKDKRELMIVPTERGTAGF